MSQLAEFDRMGNPYRSPAAGASTFAGATSGDSQIDELRAFVGTNTEYYLRKWAPRLQDPSGDVGMNWVAVFFPTLWFAYRKMYAATFIFFGVAVAEALLEAAVFIGMLHMPNVPSGVNLIVTLVTSLICGLFANAWYLSHAQRAIDRAHAQGFQDEHLLLVLSNKGGTSLLASVAINFLCFGVMVVLTAVVMFAVVVLSLAKGA
jgi:hypothetical protein